jgi:hypothetical protein
MMIYLPSSSHLGISDGGGRVQNSSYESKSGIKNSKIISKIFLEQIQILNENTSQLFRVNRKIQRSRNTNEKALVG